MVKLLKFGDWTMQPESANATCLFCVPPHTPCCGEHMVPTLFEMGIDVPHGVCPIVHLLLMSITSSLVGYPPISLRTQA